MKRVIAALLFIVLLVAFVVVRVATSSSKVEVQVANTYTVYDSIEAKGVAIRSEEVLDKSSSGYVYYTLQNGARVPKDGEIAQVYANEADALAKKNIQAVDEEIEALQTLQKQGSVSKSNMETITGQLNDSQRKFSRMANSNDFSELTAVRTEMLELLNRKQILANNVDNFETRIEALEAKRDSLTSGNYGEATGTITSPVPGYFVSSLDGYESMFDYNKVQTLTVDDVQKAIDAKPKADLNSVGKVVGNYEWYLACIVEKESLTRLNEGLECHVLLPMVGDEKIPVTVEKINKQGDQAMVLLKCSYMSEALSGVRCEQIQIVLSEITGLYVPYSAIHFNEKNQRGVFVRQGMTLSFRLVKRLSKNDDGQYMISDPNMNKSIFEAAEETKPKTTATGAEPEEESDVSTTGKAETSAVENDSDDTEEVLYLQQFDDMVVGGKNLYEGKVVR